MSAGDNYDQKPSQSNGDQVGTLEGLFFGCCCAIGILGWPAMVIYVFWTEL